MSKRPAPRPVAAPNVPVAPPAPTRDNAAMTEILLVDIADRFVAQGGAPMGIA